MNWSETIDQASSRTKISLAAIALSQVWNEWFVSADGTRIMISALPINTRGQMTLNLSNQVGPVHINLSQYNTRLKKNWFQMFYFLRFRLRSFTQKFER